MVRNPQEYFLQLYDVQSDAVFRRCLFKTSNREVALELTQEVFTRVWEHLVAGKDITNEKAFIFTIANNAIIDYYKKKRPTYEHEFSEDAVAALFEVPVEADQELVAQWKEVERCFKELEAKHREIMVLRYTEGWTVDDIAVFMKEKANTVSVWIKRSIERLRTCLGVETYA